jgi:predicted Zn-dependent protease
MSPTSRPPASARASSASTHPARRTSLAVLLAFGALLALGVSVWRTQVRPRSSSSLRLDDSVTLASPPPLPAFSPGDFRLQWEQRQAARQQLTDEASYRKFAREATLSGDPLAAYLALQDYLRGQSDPSPPLLDTLGRVQIQLGLAPDAERTYREVVRKAPEAVRGYLGLSRALMIQERRQEAADTLERGWTTLPPTDMKGHLDLVEEWEQRGELPRALQGAEALHRQTPAPPEVTLTYARLLFKLHRLPEAKQQLEPLVVAQPDNGPARTLLAGVLASPLLPGRDVAVAESALLEAIQHNTADITSLSRLGQLYQEQGRFKQAAYVYTQMLQHAPDSPDARLQLARAYARLSNAALSAEQNALAQQRLRQRLEESRLTVRRDQKPMDSSARRALAQYYIKEGRVDRALPELQAASLLSPRSAPVLQELRALYAKIGVPSPVPPGGKGR